MYTAALAAFIGLQGEGGGQALPTSADWRPVTNDGLDWTYFHGDTFVDLGGTGTTKTDFWVLARFVEDTDPDPYSFYVAEAGSDAELADIEKPYVLSGIVRVEYDGDLHDIGFDYSSAHMDRFDALTSYTIPAISTSDPSMTVLVWGGDGTPDDGFTSLPPGVVIQGAYKATTDLGAGPVTLSGLPPEDTEALLINMPGASRVCGPTYGHYEGTFIEGFGYISNLLVPMPTTCLVNEPLYGWGMLTGSGSGEW